MIFYNTETKKAELMGAEAMSREGQELAATRKWFRAKNFKLHLQPKNLRKADMKLDPLPRGIPLAQIYSDFMGYLLKHTRAFVETRMPHGKQTWEKYKPTIEVVIAHPNGWGTPEHDFLRKAAIDCGFVGADNASRQVQFVTEAEASVHYCIHHSSFSNKLEVGTNLAVCDAGGSTVDTTLYSVVSTSPILQLREVQMSDSIQAGGILVNIKFEESIRRMLKGFDPSSTGVDLDDFIAAAVEDFENYAKRNFGSSNVLFAGSETVSIRVPNTGSYSTTLIKVHRGSMKVHSSIIKECFDACARTILSSLGEQLKNQSVQHILLVGGFGDSPYLHTQFESLESDSRSCEVVLANDLTSKAVADGSVIWDILCSVVSRTPRRSLGIICAGACLPWMPEAEGRMAFIGPEGIPLIPGKWVQFAKKGVPVDAKATFRQTFHRSIMQSNPVCLSLKVELFGYSGEDEPLWAKDPKGVVYPGFEKVCTIEAQLWDLEGALKRETGLTGIDYWDFTADVCICFGATELQAHIEWEQNGVMRKGPATIVSGRPIDL
ncbi:hypothetical protein OPQ81_003920 [Rhizoctonia solani]|nr:hypothetical protein OPQ81_003920 [Rhizoctonia solani]